uniref:Putative ovule protein n=1 Tax=Solanum chacoense TaxID=4108 RepID=A0A0V0H5L6_SOLCH
MCNLKYRLIRKVGHGLESKLCGLFTFDAPPVSDSPIIHYFWRIRHAPLDIIEVSEQHRLELL